MKMRLGLTNLRKRLREDFKKSGYPCINGSTTTTQCFVKCVLTGTDQIHLPREVLTLGQAP